MSIHPVLSNLKQYGPCVADVYKINNPFWIHKQFCNKIKSKTSQGLLAEPVLFNEKNLVGNKFLRYSNGLNMVSIA